MADPVMFPITYEDRDYSTGVAKPTDANVEIYYKVDPGDQLLYSGLETFGINTTKPFKGKLVNGVLQKRSGGQMELVANVDLGLEKLIYTIKFLNADVSGVAVPLQSFDFEAPTDDSELNLNSVAPVVGEQTTGYIQGPPTYAEKVSDGPPVLYQWKTAAGVNVGPPQEIDIVPPIAGDFSSNTSTSVDGEIVVFSGTGGKTGKRATQTGILKGASGVLGTATAGTDYAPATSGTAILKGNGTGGFSNASPGTDYYNPGGTDVSVADGGTGASTLAANNVLLGNGTSPVQTVAPGTSGNVLTSNGTTWASSAPSGAGLGDASTNTATSVDSEIVLFSGTGGKTLKRATQTGILKGTSGVIGTATAGTDYYNPGGTDVAVTDGGTGRSTSTTAYGLIAAGTTATGAHQTLPAGATTEMLVGGGASALPAWTTATGSGAPVRATSPTLDNPTITNYTESVVAIGTVTTASTLSLTSGTVQTATLTASTACTFTMPTATAGKSFVLYLKQAAGGGGSATFTGVKWPGGTAPTITTTGSRMDILTFVADGTNWYGSFTQNYTP